MTIKKHNSECQKSKGFVKNPGARWIQSKIKQKVLENNEVPIQDLIQTLKRKYSVEVDYMNVWRARKNLIQTFSSNEKDLKFLENYASELELANPSSLCKVEYSDRHFKRMFFSIGSWGRIYSISKKLIFLDGTFLTNSYKGILLTATGLDSDNRSFVLGFGVVEIENYDNWLWFLKCMKLVILDADQESTVIFSDREKGLISAVSSVFSSPCHVFCIKHIIRNMNLKFNMTFIKDLV